MPSKEFSEEIIRMQFPERALFRQGHWPLTVVQVIFGAFMRLCVCII